MSDVVWHESGKEFVDVREIAEGCVAFVGSRDLDPGQLPVLLSQAVQDWLLEHRRVRVRSTVPIDSKGNTVAIYLWYDVEEA